MKLERRATITELDLPEESLLSVEETVAGFVVEKNVGEKLLWVQGLLPRPLFPLSE